jgi:hypothetical protein
MRRRRSAARVTATLQAVVRTLLLIPMLPILLPLLQQRLTTRRAPGEKTAAARVMKALPKAAAQRKLKMMMHTSH